MNFEKLQNEDVAGINEGTIDSIKTFEKHFLNLSEEFYTKCIKKECKDEIITQYAKAMALSAKRAASLCVVAGLNAFFESSDNANGGARILAEEELKELRSSLMTLFDRLETPDVYSVHGKDYSLTDSLRAVREHITSLKNKHNEDIDDAIFYSEFNKEMQEIEELVWNVAIFRLLHYIDSFMKENWEKAHPKQVVDIDQPYMIVRQFIGNFLLDLETEGLAKISLGAGADS